jgi:hypothetical protein
MLAEYVSPSESERWIDHFKPGTGGETICSKPIYSTRRVSTRHTFLAVEDTLEVPQVRRREGIDHGIDPRQVNEGCWQYRILFVEPFLDSRN